MSRIQAFCRARSGHAEIVARQIAPRCHADLERSGDSAGRDGVPGCASSAPDDLEALCVRHALARLALTGREGQAHA